ncbi:MAG TPA: M23 family metallopeptidase [Clostridia bacterium]|nr:M23 family metallopeptidase [Clostridia bacterium]
MGRLIIRALAFVVLFISACSIIGLQEDHVSFEKSEVSEQVELLPEPIPEIVFSGMEVLPGGFFGIYLKGLTDRDEIQIVTTLVQEQPSFFSHLEGKLAIVGVSCRTKEGEYKYKVQVQRDGETAAQMEEILKVLPKEFEKQYLEVSTTQKSQRSDESFDEDSVHTNRAKSVTSEKPLWEGAFVKPVEGRISTDFGMIRYINKEESGRHSGFDIAAAKGTPVKAANNGIVRLSMMLKVTGNTVIIDHGFNIYSSYAHLDKLLVTEGAEVKKGDIIGEVGTTGFSTGPHLHWTATIGKLFINPEALMEKDPLEFVKMTGQTDQ